jgi:hypothetical protein
VKGVHDDNQVFGGAGNDRITVGNGNEWVQGGSGNEYIQGGSGNDWLFGGSGNDTIIGGTGMDYIQGGGGQNTLYGHGEHDVLDDGPTSDMIYANGWNPSVQDPEGFASDQICHPTFPTGVYDGSQMTTVNDSSAFYGRYCYFTPSDPDNLNDGANRIAQGDSGLATYFSGCQRLEGIMQVAVYVRWDAGVSAPGGWTHDAWYTLTCGGVQDVIGPFDQSSPSGSGSDPWQMISGQHSLPNGFYNGGAITVAITNYDPRVGSTDNGDGRALQLGSVMLHPLWPTVSVTAVGQSPQPTDAAGNPIAPADANQYAAWLDAWQSIPVPVEDGSDRTEIELRASIDSVFSNVTDWHAVLPNISGLEFWTSATGGTTPLTPDANGNLIDQAFSGNGTFDMTLWVSSVSSESLQPISFSAEDIVGGPTVVAHEHGARPNHSGPRADHGEGLRPVERRRLSRE